MSDNLILKFPSFDETIECNEVYNTVFEKCKEKGIWTKEEMLFQLNLMGIFTDKMQEEMDNLLTQPYFKYPTVDQIDSKENTPEISRFIDSQMIEVICGERKVKFKDILIQREESGHPTFQKYKELAEIRNRYVKLTCEGLAEGAKTQALTYYSTYKNKTERLWKSYEEFLNSKNRVLLIYLNEKAIDFLNGIPATTLRRIARHPSWRTKWIAATKIGNSLFNGDICNFDTNKTFLIFWSSFYDSVSEGMNPPEQFIMEDDEKLDNFLESKRNEKTKMDTANMTGDRAFFNTKVNKIPKKK